MHHRIDANFRSKEWSEVRGSVFDEHGKEGTGQMIFEMGSVRENETAKRMDSELEMLTSDGMDDDIKDVTLPERSPKRKKFSIYLVKNVRNKNEPKYIRKSASFQLIFLQN